MTAVHGLENTIRPSLNRQMQIRHQLSQIAVCSNQSIIHVARMAGRVTQTRHIGNACKAEQQFAKAPFATVIARAMPCIDVLAQKRQLAHTTISKTLGLSHDLRNAARDFRATRVRHHTESAELVTTFLNGEEGRNTPLARFLALWCRQMREFVFNGVFGFYDLFATRTRASASGRR